MAGIVHDFGRVIEPARLCHYWLSLYAVIDAKIIEIEEMTMVLCLLQMDVGLTLIKSLWRPGLACPKPCANWQLPGYSDITTGQVSYIPQQPKLNALRAGLGFGGYLTPHHNGFHELGATFDRSEHDWRS